MKKLFYPLLLITTLFLVSCTLIEQDANETTNKMITLSNGTKIAACVPHSGCISSIYKAYQLENCSWVDRKECALGCVEGECKAAQTCTRGYKCHGTRKRGLQIESCEWIIEEDCLYGCENAECLPKPNVTEVVEEVVEEDLALPLEKTYLLPEGAEDLIEYEGNEYVLGIRILEIDRVRLNIDGKRTDWLKEDDSVVRGGINVTIVDILFQPYEGGTRAISYKIGDN